MWETRWPKQVQQISWNALLKYILELVACDIHHADKYWIIVGQKVTFLTVCTLFLEKYPFVYLRDQAIFIGAWGQCKCKLLYEKKCHMAKKRRKKKCSTHGWQQERKKVLAPWHSTIFPHTIRQNILYCGKSYSFHSYCRQKILQLIVFAVLAARGVRIFFSVHFYRCNCISITVCYFSEKYSCNCIFVL